MSTPDIIVSGAGPAGMLCSLILAQDGFQVALIGPEAKADRRTTALMVPALKILEKIDILDALRPQAQPMRSMRILDATKRLVTSPIVTFQAAEIGEEQFGLNIPNNVLLSVLQEKVETHPNIRRVKSLVADWTLDERIVIASTEKGERIEAKLAIAADGRNSPARTAAGISIKVRGHDQSALVLNFAHTRGHGATSNEFHTPSGPFTQVPLPGNRSSLVWVLRRDEVDAIAALDDATLSRRVEERMQSMLGRVTVEDGRQVYPLSSGLPDRFAARRVALVGEAAHYFPPIGAQGLNLALRDMVDLLDMVRANRVDPGCNAALTAYDRRRRPDVTIRAGAVNMLNSSLLSSSLPSQLLRTVGLSVLNRVSPLRSFFMREGLRPGSGLSGLLADIRDQLRG
ncbi:UbiH/UbiF family hydroxylase [Limoniibacter endophyticus]|uniref:2-octaprenyl-6-methoxyphenyl hydroxylase n=1 Tax=Limoniibacter endophyticus TaxID=1565040 RepID=A0A8J3GG84_9HYPH|nr:UbiH/UbiF family hydroxylase [Limoniibacter endophyticus]GHC63111.1 2-octaprenyl-6-methoxyphenyl hydroxylase [Limoniibacter endophyticus]